MTMPHIPAFLTVILEVFMLFQIKFLLADLHQGLTNLAECAEPVFDDAFRGHELVALSLGELTCHASSVKKRHQPPGNIPRLGREVPEELVVQVFFCWVARAVGHSALCYLRSKAFQG